MLATTETHGGRSPTKPEDDFKNLVDLMSVYAEADNQMAQLVTTVTEGQLDVVDEHKDEYTKLQKTLVEAEAAMEIIARRHPDWFVKKATMGTPYGSVALKKNPPKLVVPNEEVTIALIQAAIKQKGDKDQSLHRLLRVKTELNLEALEDLTDVQLEEYRITRSQSDTFTIKPNKIDLGKAVKEAAQPKNNEK